MRPGELKRFEDGWALVDEDGEPVGTRFPSEREEDGLQLPPVAAMRAAGWPEQAIERLQALARICRQAFETQQVFEQLMRRAFGTASLQDSVEILKRLIQQRENPNGQAN